MSARDRRRAVPRHELRARRRLGGRAARRPTPRCCGTATPTIERRRRGRRSRRLRARRLPAHGRDRPLLAGDGTRSPSSRAAGGPVVGICNGFQVLTEAHLLPGALQKNAGLKFLCETVELRVETTTTVLTNACERRRSGCASRSTTSRATTCATPATLDAAARRRPRRRPLHRQPNGSLDDIAGICNDGPQRRRADAAPRARLRRDARLGRRRRAAAVAARGGRRSRDDARA